MVRVFQKRWRSISHKVGVVFAAMLMVLVATPQPAQAGVASGTRWTYEGPASSHGYLNWNKSTPYLQVQSYAQNATLPTNACVDSLFDWQRDEGHHDARFARVCLSGGNITGVPTERTDLDGMQKAGACYGADNGFGSPARTCENASGWLITVTTINPVLPSDCARAWKLTAGGSGLHNSGGDPIDCSG